MNMTFGEKLSRLRKENNYTQEQLAEMLGVSRQSISKWESDIAYPETDKLIKIGKIFACSMDYLLNEEISERRGEQQSDKSVFLNLLKWQFRERKSEKIVFGMPLYHIGRNAHGFFAVGLKARGVFSIGLLSRGVVSLGLLSLGVISIGVLAFGLIAAGVLALGAFAAGAIALGLIAMGAISVGILSFGALSVGCFSVGAMAIGKYAAVGDHAYGIVAIGRTVAQGSAYSYVGDIGGADIPSIVKCLDSSVPHWLNWAKDIFKSLILKI